MIAHSRLPLCRCFKVTNEWLVAECRMHVLAVVLDGYLELELKVGQNPFLFLQSPIQTG